MGSVSLGQKGLMDHGNQRAKLPVYDSIVNGNGNYTWTMDHLMREFYFSNDDTQAQTATVQLTGPNGLNLSFILLPGDYIDERVPEFSAINITTASVWRAYVRSARVD